MAGEDHEVTLADGLLHPGVDGLNLVGTDMAHVPGAASPDDVPGADQAPGLVGIQADDDNAARRPRRGRQPEPLRQVRIRIAAAVQDLGLDGRQVGVRIGTAPTDLVLAGRRRCREAGLGAAAARLSRNVASDEVALGQGFVGGLVAGILWRGAPPAGLVPMLHGRIELDREDVVAVDPEHQAVVVTRQDGTRVLGTAEHRGHARGLDPAGQVQDITQMQEGFVGVVLQGPFGDAAAEQGLFRGPLGDLDIGVDRTVVVVQWVAGGQMLLGVADRDDGGGQGPISAGGFRPGTRLRDEGRASAQYQREQGRGEERRNACGDSYRQGLGGANTTDRLLFHWTLHAMPRGRGWRWDEQS